MGEFNLSKVKRQARKEAWYDKPGEKPNYNPFRKSQSETFRRKNTSNSPVKRAWTTSWAGGSSRISDQYPGLARPEAASALESLAPLEPKISAPIDGPVRHSSFNLTEGQSPKPNIPKLQEAESSDLLSPILEGISPIHVHQDLENSTESNGHARKRIPRKPQKDGLSDAEAEVDDRKNGTFTIRNQLQRTILGSWLNLLLILVPVGFVFNYVRVTPIAVFFVNLLAVIPVSGLLGKAVEEIQLRTDDLSGVLVYVTFGNAAVLVTSVFLLRSEQVEILKTSLTGSILTINLFNIGVAFLVGGLRRSEQFFNESVAHWMTGLLLVTVTALLIPTASSLINNTSTSKITSQSRGIAPLLIIVYGLYLFFKLNTHKAIFKEESRKVAVMKMAEDGKNLARAGGAVSGGIADSRARYPGVEKVDDLIHSTREPFLEDEDDEDNGPQLHILVCIAILVLGTTLVAFNTQFMTDSIQGLIEKAGVSNDFIGIVLLPLLSNDFIAVKSALKDKMDVTIEASLGKSLQTTLFVIPVLVLVAWGMHVGSMNLEFDGFQVTALFASVLLVQNGISAGKSNWLIGATFVFTYVMIGVAAWFQD